ncbi:P-loop containing nucleoside triphosphate hydrolase protein [Auriscalpium vulgare]|uniref:P-loop containing nucleoside triphosphate hydrolase protein n=1 Tax=Auriscalpium vulgare TaxID=40419 RepID=A0ACB8S3L4_9AGAM|nr:P-loop containing nucleoside triphosphate hydrolase protein [Auriscalpium vulgare]
MSDTPEAANIRVVTTIGHVDHGKTTLMDALLAANNIISARMAGKIRYMDSREDEQERGITMESSAVSLRFKVMEKNEDGESSPKTFFVNMIDTPGHVDFSSEVSTASRLVDGALVLVDVVEGVSSQTISVLRQARQDRLHPILVINKLDRLVTELKHTPMEAYHHLSQLIEQANAVMGSLFAGERMEDDLRWREERERRLAKKKDIIAEQTDAAVSDEADLEDFQEKDDEDIYFAPEKGNVVFASAIGGWGFRVSRFAQIFAAKLGIKEASFRKVLWGDYYLDPKTKRVIGYKHLRGRSLKPLFVQIVLENIWAVYDAVLFNPNSEKVKKIVATLNLKIAARDLNSKDPHHLLPIIFTQWLPLSSAIIQTIIDIVPPPNAAQRTRIPKMLHPDIYEESIPAANKLEEDLYSCNSGVDATVVAYVSKMFAVPEAQLPEHQRRALNPGELRTRAKEAKEARLRAEETEDSTDEPPSPSDLPAPESTESLLGFARLYSGVLRVGSRVACVLPKYKNALGPGHPRNRGYVAYATIDALYTMMGRGLVAVESVSAGNIFAMKGLEGKVWRSATVCSPSASGIEDQEVGDWMVNLGGIDRQVPPIVRVALEPAAPADMPKLIRGMKLLSQADPCAETYQQSTGEHVILTAGELHLERCLKDLRERFAKIEIQASKPIVPFRETAIDAQDMAHTKTAGAPRGTILGSSHLGLVNFTIRAVPIPATIIAFLRDNLTILKGLERERAAREGIAKLADKDGEIEEAVAAGDVVRVPTVRPDQFWDMLTERCRDAGPEWVHVVDKIWATGPQGTGESLLIDGRDDTGRHSLRRRLAHQVEESASDGMDQVAREFDANIETGFQVATSHGPLCGEPVEGMAFFVQQVEIDQEGVGREAEQNRMSQITGSLITAVKDACRNGLLDWSPRLKLAMYSCDIQASTDVLGKVYGVVAKRRGRIVAEEMKEGTSFFTVRALLPVVESFGFADDIRKRTSGAASPQLVFDGYEMLDQDPFWVPTTEEELEDLGEKSDRENVAKNYMDVVRERKGMFVNRKIVETAEKQRTLKR